MKYQIVEAKYYNEFGEEKSKVYQIRRRKKFLGISYWSWVTHQICGMGDCYDVRTEFESHSKAHDFVVDVLCGNECRDGWNSKVISEFDCNMSKVCEKD
jgi:hypothetical protein